MVIKRSRVIISFKARESLRSHIEYLKREVSEETASYIRKGIMDKCHQLKDFSGYSLERYLEIATLFVPPLINMSEPWFT